MVTRLRDRLAVDVDDLHMVRLGLTWNFTALFDTPAPVIDAPVYKP